MEKRSIRRSDEHIATMSQIFHLQAWLWKFADRSLSIVWMNGEKMNLSMDNSGDIVLAYEKHPDRVPLRVSPRFNVWVDILDQLKSQKTKKESGDESTMFDDIVADVQVDI